MPTRKRTGMAFYNNMYTKPRSSRRKLTVAPPTISLEDAVSAGRNLGYLRDLEPAPLPTTNPTPEEDWHDVLPEVNHDSHYPDTAPTMESASKTLARLSQGQRFAEKRQRALHQWYVLSILIVFIPLTNHLNLSFETAGQNLRPSSPQRFSSANIGPVIGRHTNHTSPRPCHVSATPLRFSLDTSI